MKHLCDICFQMFFHILFLCNRRLFHHSRPWHFHHLSCRDPARKMACVTDLPHEDIPVKGLHQIIIYSGLKRFLRNQLTSGSTEHDKNRMLAKRVSVIEFLNNCNPVYFWHNHIQKHNIWCSVLYHINGILSIVSFSNDRQPVLGIDHLIQST